MILKWTGCLCNIIIYIKVKRIVRYQSVWLIMPIHLFPKNNELTHYNDRARIDPVKRIDIRGQVVMNKIQEDITVNISAIDPYIKEAFCWSDGNGWNAWTPISMWSHYLRPHSAKTSAVLSADPLVLWITKITQTCLIHQRYALGKRFLGFRFLTEMQVKWTFSACMFCFLNADFELFSREFAFCRLINYAFMCWTHANRMIQG